MLVIVEEGLLLLGDVLLAVATGGEGIAFVGVVLLLLLLLVDLVSKLKMTSPLVFVLAVSGGEDDEGGDVTCFVAAVDEVLLVLRPTLSLDVLRCWSNCTRLSPELLLDELLSFVGVATLFPLEEPFDC